MIWIAVDAMGGDYAPRHVVDGALAAVDQELAPAEHHRQRREEDETLGAAAQPQMTGAGHRPRRETQQHEPA